MAISLIFPRPKLVTTVDETVPITATITEDTVNKNYAVDLKYTVTKDDTTTATKVLKRIKILPVISGTTVRLDLQELTFAGTAPDTPTDVQASVTGEIIRGVTMDLDTFLTAVGDARKNT